MQSILFSTVHTTTNTKVVTSRETQKVVKSTNFTTNAQTLDRSLLNNMRHKIRKKQPIESPLFSIFHSGKPINDFSFQSAITFSQSIFLTSQNLRGTFVSRYRIVQSGKTRILLPGKILVW